MGGVMVVDDHRLMGDAIGAALLDAGLEVTETATSCADAMRVAAELHPSMAVIDLRLPDGDGLDLGRELLRAGTVADLVAMTGDGDPSRAVAARRAGFRAFVSKDVRIPAVVALVRDILEGEAPGWTHLARRRMDVRGRGPIVGVGALTGRERQVLDLLGSGMSGRQIAGRLGISLNTVRTHVQSILSKLQVSSRAEAVATLAAPAE